MEKNFDVPVKNKEAYEKIMSISKNDYMIGNLLDYEYLNK